MPTATACCTCAAGAWPASSCRGCIPKARSRRPSMPEHAHALLHHPVARLGLAIAAMALLFGALAPGFWTLGNWMDVAEGADRKSTRLNSSHLVISYAVFCLKKK